MFMRIDDCPAIGRLHFAHVNLVDSRRGTTAHSSLPNAIYDWYVIEPRDVKYTNHSYPVLRNAWCSRVSYDDVHGDASLSAMPFDVQL